MVYKLKNIISLLRKEYHNIKNIELCKWQIFCWMLLNIIQRNNKDNISWWWYLKQHDRRDGVVVDGSSRMREIVFNPRSGQGSDTSTAKRSALNVSVAGLRRWPF